MAETRDRAIAGFFAVVFIVSTLAISVGVVFLAVQDNKQSSQEVEMEENKLQGTKLTNFTPVSQVSELEPIDTKVGTGEAVKPNDTITFHYTGALASDGTIFQSSRDTGQPVTLALKDLIPGWQEGIPGMRVGGERRLLIPYAQAYGEAGRPDGGIPPKADLVFDITVTAIEK